ncbi:alpha/beta hydrolase [Aeromicrobium sp. YIM 150415]|uniref:alpha/beta hydrolase n=1 Tax=Aeromicrobium sp. YIM 150415 TaxID=2803912 RepID=UPI0019627A5C|nr:alpha/beta hydrolase [Aeromicrobium sp. YIM 150415]MBM9463142.1 alpha/beta hydrolase [Aeromicrobium sp. YIM 150415]
MTAEPRRLPSLIVATVLAIVIALSQLPAILPSSWLQPLLASPWSQYGIVSISVARDELGGWVVLLAIVAALLAWRALRARRSLVRRSVGAVAGLALLASAVTSGLLLYTSIDQGAGFRPFAPLVPTAGGHGGPDETLTVGSADGEALRADLYRPSGDEDAPVVLYIHGGGFDGGARNPNALNRYLADRGYAVLDVDYRLARPDRPTWDLATADIGCALSWLGREGPAFGLDTDRVALLGESAGGNLALNAAYRSQSGDLEPSCGSADDLPQVSAVIGGYPVVDLAGDEARTGLGRLMGEVYIGGAPDEFPDRYAAIDPASHVAADSPPTLVYHGTRDHLVLPGPVEDFVARIREAGVTTRYTAIPATDHGAGSLLGTSTWGTGIIQAVVVQWLDDHVA